MNTIIIGALALLVLVVVILIFTGNMGEVIEKFTGIRSKVGHKADCTVIDDPTLDADNDGLWDNHPYTVKYRENGKEKTVKCECDWDKGGTVTPKKKTDAEIKYC